MIANSNKTHRKPAVVPVRITYEAAPGRYSIHKQGGDWIFALEAEPGEQGTQKDFLDAFAVRSKFERIDPNALDDPGAVAIFLEENGLFLPHQMRGERFSLSYFQRWKRFVWFVREHRQLASVMQSGEWTEEEGEILKALSGNYKSAFFKETVNPLEPDQQNDLYRWFVHPPGPDSNMVGILELGMTIKWLPKTVDETLLRNMRRGGAMVDYLVPSDQIEPALVINTNTAIHAIAATIFADRFSGVEVKVCPGCKCCFEAGRRREYCDNGKCAKRIRQRRFRDTQREKRGKEKGQK